MCHRLAADAGSQPCIAATQYHRVSNLCYRLATPLEPAAMRFGNPGAPRGTLGGRKFAMTKANGRDAPGMDRLIRSLLLIGQATRTIGLTEAREVGLTPVQAQTLLFVKRTKSFATSVGNLANHLGASHASTVGVVDALVARGLVERHTGPRDRRVTLLRLTPAGEETCERLSRWGHLLAEALTGLSEEERAGLEHGLGGVVWSLRAAGHLDVAEPCFGCAYFEENARPDDPEPHRCSLFDGYLSQEQTLTDCPDHVSLEVPDRLKNSPALRRQRRLTRLQYFKSVGTVVEGESGRARRSAESGIPVAPSAPPSKKINSLPTR
jgi:DNA-binding MarR family transcriptional regulator